MKYKILSHCTEVDVSGNFTLNISSSNDFLTSVPTFVHTYLHFLPPPVSEHILEPQLPYVHLSKTFTHFYLSKGAEPVLTTCSF